MSQWWYYDFMNINSALSQALIKQGYIGALHDVKDIASVKVSQFKYKNIEKIPDLTSEILECCLMFNFQLCFYNSPSLGWVLCRYVMNSEFNSYLRPVTVNLLSFKGDSIAESVPYKDIILAKDNSMDIIPFLCLIEYIQKLEKVDTAVFKVLNIASLPLALIGNKKLAKQLQETAKKLGNNEAFIAGDESILDTVKGFNIDVPINPLDIYELKTKYKNECLASIGIYSVEQKKERKIVNEVRSQNDYTDRIYMDMKSQRQRFVDMLNKADPSLGIELIETKTMIIDDSVEEDRKRALAMGQVVNKGNDFSAGDDER